MATCSAPLINFSLTLGALETPLNKHKAIHLFLLFGIGHVWHSIGNDILVPHETTLRIYKICSARYGSHFISKTIHILDPPSVWHLGRHEAQY